MSTVTESGLQSSGFHLDQMISLEVNRLLTDNANLRNSVFIDYAGSINGMGTDTIRARKYGLGGRDGFADATSEAHDHAADSTAVSVSYVDVAVARKYLIRAISDLATISGYGSQDLNPAILGADMAASYENLFAKLTASTAAGLSTIKGSSSVDFTVDLLFNSIFALETADTQRGADAPFAAVLHPKALTDLQDSLRNETSNAVSMMQATAAMLQAKGKGYMGNLMGVEIYRSSHVTESAGAKNNFFLSPGCITYADGVPQLLPSSTDTLNLGKVLVEMDRVGTAATTRIVGHCYIGFAILDANRGVLAKCSAS